MLAVATRKGAKLNVGGAWSDKEGTVRCPQAGCQAEYFLGQQMLFRDDALWTKQTQELLDLLRDDHRNGRQHLDRVDFDL
jgi:hypothetical protein